MVLLLVLVVVVSSAVARAPDSPQVVATKQQSHVLNEKKILAMMDHPFVLSLIQTYQVRGHAPESTLLRDTLDSPPYHAHYLLLVSSYGPASFFTDMLPPGCGRIIHAPRARSRRRTLLHPCQERAAI